MIINHLAVFLIALVQLIEVGAHVFIAYQKHHASQLDDTSIEPIVLSWHVVGIFITKTIVGFTMAASSRVSLAENDKHVARSFMGMLQFIIVVSALVMVVLHMMDYVSIGS